MTKRCHVWRRRRRRRRGEEGNAISRIPFRVWLASISACFIALGIIRRRSRLLAGITRLQSAEGRSERFPKVNLGVISAISRAIPGGRGSAPAPGGARGCSRISAEGTGSSSCSSAGFGSSELPGTPLTEGEGTFPWIQDFISGPYRPLCPVCSLLPPFTAFAAPHNSQLLAAVRRVGKTPQACTVLGSV